MIAEAAREADQTVRLVPGEDARLKEIEGLEREIDQVAEEQKAIRAKLESLNRDQDRASAPDADVYYRRAKRRPDPPVTS
jgi:predicted phage-related endonuclease